MSNTSSPFLQFIHDNAEQNGFISLTLPDQQGVITLPQDYSSTQHIDLLQQFLSDLKQTASSDKTVTHSSPVITALNCQVTVEERTQLFKFLQA